jgi:DNA-directed RNA polymerase specialized sigma24 family protein
MEVGLDRGRGRTGRLQKINLEHNEADPPDVIGVVITPARGQEAPKGLVPSFEEFFEASYASVARALILLVGDETEAEELAEEAFVRAWERWARIRTMASPAGFVYRTALNLNRSRLRRLALARRRAVRSTIIVVPPQGWMVGHHATPDIVPAPSGNRSG